MFKIISKRPRLKFYFNADSSSAMTSRLLVFLAKKKFFTNSQVLAFRHFDVVAVTDLKFQECKSAFRWLSENHRRTVITATITWGQRNVEEFTLRRKAEFTSQYNQQFIAVLCNFSFHLSRHICFRGQFKNRGPPLSYSVSGRWAEKVKSVLKVN